MQCADFQRQLLTAVEERDGAALAALAAHAETCPAVECQRLWDDHRLLAQALDAWRGRAESPRLTQRVLAELRRPAPPMPSPTQLERVPDRPRRTADSRGALGVFAAAAALLVIVSFAFPPGDAPPQLAQPNHRPQQRLTDGAPPVHRTTVTQTPHAESPVVPDSGTHTDLADVGASYVGLATEATYLVTDLAMLIVPVRVEQPADDATGGPHWVDRLGAQIEPVREGVTSKLGEWFGPPAT